MSGSECEREKNIANSLSELSLEDFTYALPPELIAQQPAADRSSAKLLVLNRKTRKLEHRIFADLPDYLRKGDVLVLNNTRVIPARIIARRESGGLVEILLLKAEAASPGVWQAMANPLRKLKIGDRLRIEIAESQDVFVSIAGFAESADLQRRVLIDFGGQSEVYLLLSKIGQAPLPPYILRERANKGGVSVADDMERYQTVFASAPGAVAAPTAGLHFTPELLAQLKDNGVEVCYITLHVGPGTFKPITSSLEEHRVESEDFHISRETANIVNRCRRAGGRVFAVGTTSCRSLETAGASGEFSAVASATSSLYIRPGHKFTMVDSLITNFHLSRSSLLVLVSAFTGHEFIMSAYKVAIEHRYRFYSYGDAMLII